MKQFKMKLRSKRSISMLLGTLGASLLGNILEGKGVIAMSKGKE